MIEFVSIIGVLIVGMIAYITGTKIYEKRLLKVFDPYMNEQTLMIDGSCYTLRVLRVQQGATLQINSPKIIEVKHKTSTFHMIDLNKKYLIITYPSKEKMLKVLNENEVRFFDALENVHGSYVVPIHESKRFIESKLYDR